MAGAGKGADRWCIGGRGMVWTRGEPGVVGTGSARGIVLRSPGEGDGECVQIKT